MKTFGVIKSILHSAKHAFIGGGDEEISELFRKLKSVIGTGLTTGIFV